MGVIPAQSKQQALMHKLVGELLSNFSGLDHGQIIYKPQLVYYLHKTFLFHQVNCFSQKWHNLCWLVVLFCPSFTTEAPHDCVGFLIVFSTLLLKCIRRIN